MKSLLLALIFSIPLAASQQAPASNAASATATATATPVAHANATAHAHAPTTQSEAGDKSRTATQSGMEYDVKMSSAQGPLAGLPPIYTFNAPAVMTPEINKQLLDRVYQEAIICHQIINQIHKRTIQSAQNPRNHPCFTASALKQCGLFRQADDRECSDLYPLVAEYAVDGGDEVLNRILLEVAAPLREYVTEKIKSLDTLVVAMRTYNQAQFDAFTALQQKNGVVWPHAPVVLEVWTKGGFTQRPQSLIRDRMVCDTCYVQVSGLLGIGTTCIYQPADQSFMCPADYHDLLAHESTPAGLAQAKKNREALVQKSPGISPFLPPMPEKLTEAQKSQRELERKQFEAQTIHGKPYGTKIPNADTPEFRRYALRYVHLHAQTLAESFPANIMNRLGDPSAANLLRAAHTWVLVHLLSTRMTHWALPAFYINDPKRYEDAMAGRVPFPPSLLSQPPKQG